VSDFNFGSGMGGKSARLFGDLDGICGCSFALFVGFVSSGMGGSGSV
jgi:hypothetical protein